MREIQVRRVLSSYFNDIICNCMNQILVSFNLLMFVVCDFR